MRKTTKKAIAAFTNFSDLKIANTSVSHKAMLRNGKFPKGDHFIVLSLHGNEIAAKDSGDGSLYITNAGWFSNTTKERLNGLPGVSIQQKNRVWYLNGQVWDGQWTKIPS